MSQAGMAANVRLSHSMLNNTGPPAASSAETALIRPCQPPISLSVSGSVTPGLTTTQSPSAHPSCSIGRLSAARCRHDHDSSQEPGPPVYHASSLLTAALQSSLPGSGAHAEVFP